jgi:hypothetical protein
MKVQDINDPEDKMRLIKNRLQQAVYLPPVAAPAGAMKSGSGRPATPSMKPSWFSLESSSRVFCFVSGKRRVEKIPVNMKKANISRLGRKQFSDDISGWKK